MKNKLGVVELFICVLASTTFIILDVIRGRGDLYIIEQGEGAWYFLLLEIVVLLLVKLLPGFLLGFFFLTPLLGLPIRFFLYVKKNKLKFNRNLWSSFFDFNGELVKTFPYNKTKFFWEWILYPIMGFALLIIIYILYYPLLVISSFYKIFLADYGIQLSIGSDDFGWPLLLSLILPSLFLFIQYKISNFLKINTLKVILFLTGVLIVMPNLYRLGITEKMNENSILHLSMLVKLCFGVLLILISILIANNSKEEAS